MKNIKFFNRIVIAAVAAMMAGCAEEYQAGPLGHDDGIAPGPVSNVTVKNTPGGAVLRYELPKDIDLQYVKAVLSNTQGKEISVSSSCYVDSLVIEGLGNTDEYNVRLYSVDNFEHHSSPVNVAIQPLTPPVVTVFESLDPKFGFGGFEIAFENASRANIGLYIDMKNATGEFEYAGSAHTNLRGGSINIRGLDTITTVYAIFVRDRFNNYSDTMYMTGRPLFEKSLPKGPMYNAANSLNPTRAYAWGCLDDNYDWSNFTAITATPTQEFPHFYTVDLGGLFKMSRYRIWQRVGDDTLFQQGMPKKWKLYGKATSQEMWTFIMNCESVKPSGLPLGQYDQGDWDYAAAGEEFIFPVDIPEIRFLQFEFTETWGGYKNTYITELSFWGNDEL